MRCFLRSANVFARSHIAFQPSHRVFRNPRIRCTSPGSRPAKIFAELTAVVAEMQTSGADRLSGEGTYHAGTSTKQFWAAELRTDLEDIRDTAVAISVAEDTPDFDDQFPVPRSRSYDTLANAARAFLKDAAPHKALFLEFELRPDFLEDLKADLEAFEKADDTQDAGLGTQVGGSATSPTSPPKAWPSANNSSPSSPTNSEATPNPSPSGKPPPTSPGPTAPAKTKPRPPNRSKRHRPRKNGHKCLLILICHLARIEFQVAIAGRGIDVAFENHEVPLAGVKVY